MKTVLLDLDGVIADFHTHWHTYYPECPRPNPWPKGVWALADAHGVSWQYTCERLGLKFWRTIPFMFDARDILNLLESKYKRENIYLCTSNHVDDAGTAAKGKVEWIEKHMPEYKHQYFIGSAKHIFARPDSILFDDKNENVDQFIAAGGQACLVPRPWNRNHQLHTMSTLRGFIWKPL